MAIPANRALRYGVAVGGVVAALVLLVVFFPWNVLRRPLASYASAKFDRAVAIAGDLDVQLGWTTRVQIDGVSIANVAWSADQPMVDAKRVVLWFTPGALLKGQPVKIQLVETSILLERNANGDDNWSLGNSDSMPRIGNIDVDRSAVQYRDAKARADVKVALQTVAAAGDNRATLDFSGQGTLRGEAFRLEGTSVGLARLQDINDP